MRNVNPQQCVSNSRESGTPWRNGLKRAISWNLDRNTWTWLLSSLTPGAPSLFSFYSSHSSSPPLPLHLPSAPPHSLFMSAWVAPFHYTRLPAHYQSHNCFNNRSPSPSLCFYYHDNPQWGEPEREQETEENSRGRKKKKNWMRGWECHPLTSGSICKDGKQPGFQ